MRATRVMLILSGFLVAIAFGAAAVERQRATSVRADLIKISCTQNEALVKVIKPLLNTARPQSRAPLRQLLRDLKSINCKELLMSIEVRNESPGN